MAYARKASTDKLKTFGKLAAALWKTISYLSKDPRRIDTAFDLRLENPIKYVKRVRLQKATTINVVIESTDLPLPVTMENFWASSGNKEKLQMFFFNWLWKSYKDD